MPTDSVLNARSAHPGLHPSVNLLSRGMSRHTVSLEQDRLCQDVSQLHWYLGRPSGGLRPPLLPGLQGLIL